jgi:hypothetical protein
MVSERVSDVMDGAIGWLLDVTVERNVATLWIKMTDGGILRLVDKYQPCLYVLHTKPFIGRFLYSNLAEACDDKISKVNLVSNSSASNCIDYTTTKRSSV